MKKIKSLFKKNVKLVIGIMIGIILAGGGAAVVYALAATSVTYTDTNNIGATTVQDAIDKLYTMAQPPLALNSTTATAGGTVFLLNIGSKKYACNSNIGGKTICVTNGPANNKTDYNARVSALQTACTAVGGSFSSDSSYARCYSGSFTCRVTSTGVARCNDNSSDHNCAVTAGGSVDCR